MKRKLSPKEPQASIDAPLTPQEIKAWRKRQQWTQARASEHLGVSKRTVQNWEQGWRSAAHPVAVRKLMAIARPPKAA